MLISSNRIPPGAYVTSVSPKCVLLFSLKSMPLAPTHVTFHEKFDYLPTSVSFLSLGRCFFRELANLPLSLTHLDLRSYLPIDLSFLPANLKILSMAQSTLHSDKLNWYFPVDHLPSTLTKLQIGDCFDLPIDNLPLSLTELSVGRNFKQTVNYLPASLIKLELGEYFNSLVDYLPSSL